MTQRKLNGKPYCSSQDCFLNQGAICVLLFIYLIIVTCEQ